MEKSLRILFVEDREDDMLLVLRALSKGNFVTDHYRVENEVTLRDALTNQEWDIVIADFSLPSFTGVEALKVFNEYALEIPFILVSGSVGEEIAVQMMKDGANDYIMKNKLARIVPAVERELKDSEVKRRKKEIEADLKKASIIIDSTDVTLWQWKAEPGWPVVYVSNNVIKYGYQIEEFTSGMLCYSDLIHPDDRQQVFEQSSANIEKHHDLYKQHYRILAKDGSLRWIDDYTTIVRDSQGSVDHIQGITYDVSSFVKLEKDLKYSENLYKVLVETSPDAICMLDESFNTVFANCRKAAMFGFDSPEELLGLNGLQFLSPQFQTLFVSSYPIMLEKGSISVPEVEFVRRDGSTFLGDLRSVVIHNEETKTNSIINMITDITERKLMQDNLSESENRFKLSFEHAPIGMDILDIDGTIMRANKAFCDIVGYSEEELQKLTFYKLTHPEDLESNVETVSDMMHGKSDVVSIQKRYLRKDGEIIWVNVRSTMIRNNQGTPLYFIAQVQDVTKSRKAENEILMAKEKAEESDRLKSALLANMSHELRTPLNGILGFSDLIRKTALDLEVTDMANLIYKSGKRLMNTLDSIMLLAQLESNSKVQNLTTEYSNISRELASICQYYSNEIKQKGLDFIYDIHPNIFLKIEPKLFKQAIGQLIENAIKFTIQGVISVSAALAETPSGTTLQITVADSGIGIRSNMHQTIFAEFRQASEGYGRDYEGSGLGLPITKKIINLYGGSIEVQSELNKGSIFTISLPYVMNNEIQQIVQPKPDVPAGIATAKSDLKPLILIVEDNPVNQKLASSFLKNDYITESAFDGETAVLMARDKAYEAFLMDINLGSGIDGLEATKQIRALPNYTNQPIIAVTGYTMIGDRERIIAGGCTHYIAKPFSKNLLIKTLDEALS